MQYSPKLKRVMEEIKAIIKNEDIAAVIILHNIEGKGEVNKDAVYVQGYTEFFFNINTSYSAASIENDRFKVKGKAIHYPSKEVRDVQIANTVNMLEHLGKWSGQLALQFRFMDKELAKIVEKIDDGDPGTTTSHTQQNN